MADEPPAKPDLIDALRKAALTGLISFGLFLPLIGLKTVQDIRNELILETRWPLLFALVLIIAGLQFLYTLVLVPWLSRRAAAPRLVDPRAATLRAAIARWAAPFAIGFVIIYPPLVLVFTGFQGAAKWIDNFGIQILIYVMLGWGLNIVVGLAGLLDLGYVAFYAVGAYSYA